MEGGGWGQSIGGTRAGRGVHLGSQAPRFWHWAILLAHGHEAVPPEDAPTKLADSPFGTTGEEFRRWCEETGITVCERQREGVAARQRLQLNSIEFS